MIDVKTADRELQTYIRPQTFPVAIRMLRPDEPIPDRARRPARDFKKLSMNCQVIDMARRYGWTLVLTREDSICSLGIAALGFEKPTHLHNSGARIFGQTQDHEMAFTIPWSQMEEIIEGLRGTHAGGIRYPITQFMEYEAKMPPWYIEANRVWDTEKGKTAYSNRDRVVAAYKRSFADRVPVYPIVASFAGTLDGLSIEEYCTNVPKAITAMLNYYERYQP